MNEAAPEPAMPAVGSLVPTACRGLMRLEANTPQAVFRGRRIFFCLESCLQNFKTDPQTSCLAGDPLLKGG
jgi:YHS domain-containing protein